jgi:hypothetical protein
MHMAGVAERQTIVPPARADGLLDAGRVAVFKDGTVSQRDTGTYLVASRYGVGDPLTAKGRNNDRTGIRSKT